MNERERWIVYPLLFLALGVALRDELFDQTWSRNVVCERLTVVDSQNGSPVQQLRIGTLGRSEEQGIAPGGELRVSVIKADTIRAGTVVADQIASQNLGPAIWNTIVSFFRTMSAQQARNIQQQTPAESTEVPGDSVQPSDSKESSAETSTDTPAETNTTAPNAPAEG